MEYISVPEYARLTGRTRQYALNLIKEGKLTAFMSKKIGRGGNGGTAYQIPVDALDPKTYRRYRREQDKKLGITAPKPEKPQITVTLEEMSEDERREVAFWKNILTDWRAFRSRGGLKAEADQIFLQKISEKYPEMHFSIRMLQRKDQAWREQGEAALIDRRGKHKNHKKTMPDEVFDVFISFYLDLNKPSVQSCMDSTERWFKREGRFDMLPLPSRQTFTREIMRRIIPAELVFGREGEKKCTDTMLPSLKRDYEDLYSNSIWVCDNHTFDVFVNDGEHEKPVRVYLTAFQDVRSRKFVGWYVTLTPCSQATLIALRRGIEENGLPDMILADNGREFLTHDIGGRGYRKSRKLPEEEHEIPTILQNLGIKFTTAMVRNARAKIIERAFLDVKNNFSKMFEGYTGGTIAERPERLKKMGKDAENFILLPDFVEYVDKYIRYIFNKHKHYGVGMDGRTPDQVYADCMVEKRIATPEQLNLMMLRNTRMQKVARNGVYVTLCGQKIYYQSKELILDHFGEKVYVRYNPDDLEEVRVYSDQDRFLCTAQQVSALSYAENKDVLKEKIRDNREYLKAVKQINRQRKKKVISELELMMWQVEQNKLSDDTKPKPSRYRIQSLDPKQEELPKAVGNDQETREPIDWTDALERLKVVKED